MKKNSLTGRYGVKTAKGNILCTDIEYHAPIFVGAGGYTPKSWKTEKGADRWAKKMNGKVFVIK